MRPAPPPQNDPDGFVHFKIPTNVREIFERIVFAKQRATGRRRYGLANAISDFLVFCAVQHPDWIRKCFKDVEF